jgi:HNH endonuclease
VNELKKHINKHRALSLLLRDFDIEVISEIQFRRVRASCRGLTDNPLNHLSTHCVKCGSTTACLTVDHIWEKTDGGNNDSRNLQRLCVKCHRIKTLISQLMREQKRGPLLGVASPYTINLLGKLSREEAMLVNRCFLTDAFDVQYHSNGKAKKIILLC